VCVCVCVGGGQIAAALHHVSGAQWVQYVSDSPLIVVSVLGGVCRVCVCVCMCVWRGIEREEPHENTVDEVQPVCWGERNQGLESITPWLQSYRSICSSRKVCFLLIGRASWF